MQGKGEQREVGSLLDARGAGMWRKERGKREARSRMEKKRQGCGEKGKRRGREKWGSLEYGKSRSLERSGVEGRAGMCRESTKRVALLGKKRRRRM